MAILAGSLAFYATAADPVVSDVTVRQQWPWSRLVDIDYVLTGEQGERMDVLLTAMDGLTTLSLPTGSLSGDLYNVVPGQRRIVWDPMMTSYTNQTFTQFRVDLAATVPPLYMIVDLTKDAGEDEQIEYVSESDLTNGVWGAWVRNPITNALGGVIVESVVWTGVTTNDIYKTDKIVLGRVPEGSYLMGGDGYMTYAVTLTKACYAGVFEVTEAQWGKVMEVSGTTSKPKATVSYDDIRGATNAVPAVDWPNTDRTVVTPDSFLGQLRSQTGIDDFDLPTGAQREYLCRAGTTTYYNDGLGTPDNTASNAQMDVLGWYIHNSGSKAQPVGLKAVNAWGLYDMHGNVYEWCLDWYGVTSGGTDPSGVDSGSNRLIRGGSWGNYGYDCRSANRHSVSPWLRYSSTGFRLVRTLP